MLTQTRLKELLEYDPETGDFWWRVDYGARICNGEYAGCHSGTGHLHISIDGKSFLAHRLAWLYMTGEWPENHIDHINRKSDDNRWANLRKATGSQNQANSGVRKDNTSGFRGVFYQRDKWVARIRFNGSRFYLGYFSTAEEAARAYDKKAKELFGKFAHLNFPEDHLP